MVEKEISLIEREALLMVEMEISLIERDALLTDREAI